MLNKLIILFILIHLNLFLVKSEMYDIFVSDETIEWPSEFTYKNIENFHFFENQSDEDIEAFAFGPGTDPGGDPGGGLLTITDSNFIFFLLGIYTLSIMYFKRKKTEKYH